MRRAALPAPGGPDELAELVGHELSRRLDRARPLWELTVIEGVAGGERCALLAKMHHALVDGVAAVDIGTVLLDPTEEPLDLPAPDGPWEARPYDRARHLARLSLEPMVRGQRLLAEGAQRALAATDPRRAAAEMRRATDLVTELARTRPQAPMTPLNRPIGPNRRYATARAGLAELKAAAKAHGATVNDAILAVVAGALRRYLARDPPGGRPVALVPVSVRQPGEEGGNRISTVLVDLPTDEADPVARLASVHDAMREVKDSAAVRAGALLVGASGWAPPVVSSTLARAMSGVRAFNLVVSNVPGPQQPFWLNGAAPARGLSGRPAEPVQPGPHGRRAQLRRRRALRPAGRPRPRPAARRHARGARRRPRRAAGQVCPAHPRVTDPRRQPVRLAGKTTEVRVMGPRGRRAAVVATIVVLSMLVAGGVVAATQSSDESALQPRADGRTAASSARSRACCAR